MAGVAVSEEKQACPWLRMEGESAKAYSHFQVYLRFGPNNRSFGKTAEEVRCSQRNIERIASRWNWAERVDAWDRHEDALNFARFERMRERAARRRMERELARQEEAENVANLLLERAQTMLAWPIQQETIVEKSEITEDGQTLHITQKVIKPVKWSMIDAMRVVEALDRMRRASVEDLTKAQPAEQIPAADIAERHFTLHTAEQIQQPAVPEQPTEASKDGDWIVDTGEEGGHSDAQWQMPPSRRSQHRTEDDGREGENSPGTLEARAVFTAGNTATPGRMGGTAPAVGGHGGVGAAG